MQLINNNTVNSLSFAAYRNKKKKLHNQFRRKEKN